MNAVEYASELIRYNSVSSQSNGPVSDYCESVLRDLGCETERIEYTTDGVLKVNIVGRKGNGSGGLAYFGHTDVVPVDDWSVTDHGPFEPVVRDGRLYGRGSTDMKGSVACMFAALAATQGDALQHPVYVACSSDEELNHRGAIEITERSTLYREIVAGKACGIVGEPTELDIVYAHKGGCQIVVTSLGRAAHSSTREGINANLAMIPFLEEMKALYDETETDTTWHDGEFDPPTICMNLGINDHTKAVNITAPQSICTIAIRPMPNTDVDKLLARIQSSAEKHGLEYFFKHQNPAFRRDPDSDFLRTCAELTGQGLPRTVAYGTEASNFSEVENLVVLGPGNIAQAHLSDEWISIDQLHRGTETYAELIRRFCT